MRDAKRPYVPEEFARRVKLHLIANFMELDGFSPMLLIAGEPGMGKTYQLGAMLRLLGFQEFPVRAVDLEDMYAGVPARRIEEKYLAASECMDAGTPAAMVIHDIDTTLGEWKDSASTVNHQNVLSVLMHICDNPHEAGGKQCRRVPIFLTGNYAERLYKPLVREGRASLFTWNPGYEERAAVVRSIFCLSEGPQDVELSLALVESYAGKPISFFSEYCASREAELFVEYAFKGVFISLLTEANCREEILTHVLRERNDVRAGFARELLEQSGQPHPSQQAGCGSEEA